MNLDIINYVKACSVCAQSKTPHQLPAGLFQPLPIPHRPWPHLSIDYHRPTQLQWLYYYPGYSEFRFRNTSLIPGGKLGLLPQLQINKV